MLIVILSKIKNWLMGIVALTSAASENLISKMRSNQYFDRQIDGQNVAVAVKTNAGVSGISVGDYTVVGGNHTFTPRGTVARITMRSIISQIFAAMGIFADDIGENNPQLLADISRDFSAPVDCAILPDVSDNYRNKLYIPLTTADRLKTWIDNRYGAFSPGTKIPWNTITARFPWSGLTQQATYLYTHMTLPDTTTFNTDNPSMPFSLTQYRTFLQQIITGIEMFLDLNPEIKSKNPEIFLQVSVPNAYWHMGISAVLVYGDNYTKTKYTGTQGNSNPYYLMNSNSVHSGGRGYYGMDTNFYDADGNPTQVTILELGTRFSLSGGYETHAFRELFLVSSVTGATSVNFFVDNTRTTSTYTFRAFQENPPYSPYTSNPFVATVTAFTVVTTQGSSTITTLEDGLNWAPSISSLSLGDVATVFPTWHATVKNLTDMSLTNRVFIPVTYIGGNIATDIIDGFREDYQTGGITAIDTTNLGISDLFNLIATDAPEYDTETRGDTPNYPTTYGDDNYTGMVTLYWIDQTNLGTLCEYMTDDTHFTTTILKCFQNPADVVVSLAKYFVNPTQIRRTGGAASKIYLGSANDTGATGAVIERFSLYDMGTVTIPEFYGNYLDNNPNTSVSIFLPFIGFEKIDADLCVGRQVNVRYGIDFATGDCTALVKIIGDNSNIFEYTYNGNCAVEYPLRSSGLGPAAIRAAVGVFGGIVSGGATVPMLTAGVENFKVRDAHGGKLTGNHGIFAPRKPFIIINRPTSSETFAYNDFYGMTANKTVTLSTQSGYTRVKYIHLDNVPATGAEIEEIEEILKNGVII